MNQIDPSVTLYHDVKLTKTKLEANVSIGDFSKVNDSFLRESVRVDRNNHFDNIQMGKHSYTGRNSILLHAKIGAFCSISWNVSIGGANHDYTRLAQHSFLYNPADSLSPKNHTISYDRFSEPLIIGNDVWLGTGAVVLRGVTIGDGAVVGANAVVTRDVPPYAIVAGTPAKILKYRFTPDIIERLISLKWWKWPDKKIQAHFKILSNHPSIDKLKSL